MMSELQEPFDIDHGALLGVAPHAAFVLGVEWAMVRGLLEEDEPFWRPIHAANRERIQRMCIRRARRCVITDHGNGWLSLEVE